MEKIIPDSFVYVWDFVCVNGHMYEKRLVTMVEQRTGGSIGKNCTLRPKKSGKKAEK